VNGAIHARERIELQATALVTGDILTPRISIVEGARITGEVKMDEKVGERSAATSPQ
jgi:cytoskeletal protein CcmA (bactofilin family)